ncbi:MAG: membrane protein insertase YidC, partial [Alphaproteobacteria bacterium]|nr:membrane protein insertase YidC [Alphaproteobacteria bacterium]
RITIRTDKLHGTLSLRGAWLDDLTLSEYRQTLDENAPPQTLLQKDWQVRFGWVSNDKTITLPDENSLWQQVGGNVLTPTTPITIRHITPEDIVLVQHISINEDFMFSAELRIDNQSGRVITLYPFGQIMRRGEPETSGLFVLHEGPIGFIGEQGLVELDYDDLLEERTINHNSVGGWVGITDKYWATVLIPPQEAEFSARFTGAFENGQPIFRSDYILPAQTLSPGASASSVNQLFAGAKTVDALDKYREGGIMRFDLLIDWGWFYFLTKPMFHALQLIYNWVGNYGIAILLVTISIKLIFFPLANRSYETMAKMKKLQPRMVEIRETYKDDRSAQQQALMSLYRDEKLNPLAGCLPILLQIPVFFALYKVLFVTIDMRHQPFFGWLTDLSAPDPTSVFNLFGLLPYDVPSFLLVGVLPLLMGITMYVQMQMNPPPPDPIQARLFQLMPIFFTFILAGFPAGLVLYWTWNNFLSILQQALIMRRSGVPIELAANLGFNKQKPDDTK